MLIDSRRTLNPDEGTLTNSHSIPHILILVHSSMQQQPFLFHLISECMPVS